MSERFDLLFVCTGNICRSPTAELLAAHRLPRDRFLVHSAGTYGLHGYGIEPGAARPLAALGIATDAFRARRLTERLIEHADLVLTATRDHRTAVVAKVPEALTYTFTMKELARLVAGIDRIDAEDPADRARLLVALAGERRGRAWAPPREDDVADPYGLGPVAYEAAIADITAALDPTLALITGTGH